MDTSPTEASPVQSTRGFKGVLAKARRGGKDTASNTSFFNGTDNNSSDSHGIRSSVESLQALEKDRASKESSIDDGTTTTKSRTLAKLIPARIKKKLKKHESLEREEEQGEDGEEGEHMDGHGNIMDPAPAAASTAVGSSRQNTIGGDSLILYDSDETESPVVSPPPLTTHPSHAGYLTSSSPLIKTSTQTETSITSTKNPSQAPKSKTFPVPNKNYPTTDINLAPRHAATLDSPQSEISSDMAEPSIPNLRGVSPGSRIKSVFASASRRKDSSPASPGRVALNVTGGGDISGDTLGTVEIENSANLKRGPQHTETTSATHSARSETDGSNTSKRDLPSINSLGKPLNLILDAPVTTVTPPTPTDQQPEIPLRGVSKTQSSFSTGSRSTTFTPTSENMISHRGARSDSTSHAPSKLSNSMSAPLTPTIEETKPPGSRVPVSQTSLGGGGGGGFFSSFFSVAQNATNSFGITQPKLKTVIPVLDEDNSRETQTFQVANDSSEDHLVLEKKELAIDTIGTGNLSLSHLGITGDAFADSNQSTETFPTVADGLFDKVKGAANVRRDEAAARAEDISAARAISAAYGEKSVNEKIATPVTEDAPVLNKSTYEASIAGDRTPPNGSVFEVEQNTRRSGSVRSRVGAVTRRHRNSSSATGNTLGSNHGASQATLAASASTPKLTGFAVATKKRNRDFHQLFRIIPEDDYLIEDYSCALQREIILAGRLYVSEGHICFSSNILGWITTVIISFDEIVSVEKENTAMVFPNAIAIQTLHARHTFRSLLSREATYELLIGIWKLSHPSLKSSLNGVRLDAGGTGDKTEKVDPSGSDDPSDVSEEEEVYDEDAEDQDMGSFTEAGNGSEDGSEGHDPATKSLARKSPTAGILIGNAAGGVPTIGEGKAVEKAAAAVAASADFPGPTTHSPTECNDVDTHFDKVVKDEVIPAPLGKVYSMVFGAASGGFMTRWFIDDQKFMDLVMEDDRKGLSEDNRTRSYSYIKPLYGAIGPKQTKCITTEYLDFIDLEKAVSVSVVTQTPDVPSGNLFSTKTKYCLTWAPGNSTRLFVNCTIEWTAKSWLKGPIEKGANEGQTSYATDLVKALRAGIASRARADTINSKIKVKGKRKRAGVELPKKPQAQEIKEPPKLQQTENWGLFEPLRGILGPVVDIFSSLVSKNMVIGLLSILVILTWLWSSTPGSKGQVGLQGIPTPERLAAYEEIWRREEHSLWDWLEERIGMEGVAYPTSGAIDQKALQKARKQREQSLKNRHFEAHMVGETIDEREFTQAIRAMEQRLDELKLAVKRAGEKKQKSEDADRVLNRADDSKTGDTSRSGSNEL